MAGHVKRSGEGERREARGESVVGHFALRRALGEGRAGGGAEGGLAVEDFAPVGGGVLIEEALGFDAGKVEGELGQLIGGEG